MLISFSGIDGSGKSTQIQILQRNLATAGRRTAYLWSRGGYTPGIAFLKTLLRKIAGTTVPPSGDIPGRTRYFRVGLIRRVWIWAALIDLIWTWGVRLRACELFGNVVICDRYLWDTRIDLGILFPNERVETWWLWQVLALLAPRPRVAVLLTAPLEVSMARVRDKGDRYPEGQRDIVKRYQMYQCLQAESGFFLLDGTAPREETAARIYKLVTEASHGLVIPSEKPV